MKITVSRYNHLIINDCMFIIWLSTAGVRCMFPVQGVLRPSELIL